MSELATARSHIDREQAVPSYLPPPFPSQTEPAADDGVEFAYYWLLIRKFRWRITALILLSTIGAVLIALALPKEYEAVATIRVDPSAAEVVGKDNSSGPSPIDTRMLVATEAKVITSPAVALKMIQDLDLYANPAFNPGAQKTGVAPVVTPALQDQVLRIVNKHLTVTQPVDTALLQIHFRAHDPQLAARAANDIADAFIAHEFQTTAKALSESSRYMTEQIDSLRAQMERDQKALVEYESKNDVLDPDDKQNIYEARLTQINSDLSAAESVRMHLQAEYELVRHDDIDALMTTTRGQALVPLQHRLLADQRQLQQLGTVYGKRHPTYLQQEVLVRHDEAVLKSQQLHIAQQVEDEYRAAVLRENLIGTALQREKNAMDAFNMRAIRYHALKAAADSSTKLFYDLQQRIQDDTVASGLRSENLRVIDPARASQRPVFPRPFLTGFLAFLLSSMLGIGGALAVGVLDRTVSNPDQVEQWFHVPVVGSLPAVDLHINSTAVGPILYGAREGGDRTRILPASGSANPAYSSFHESVLSLRSAIQFAVPDNRMVLAITSSMPGEGKSTISTNIAASFAAIGLNTILIDADMRKPNAHRIFRVSNRIGLSSVLNGTATLDEAIIRIDTHLSILPAGPGTTNPAHLLASGLPNLVEHLRTRFSIVLIDCPPVLGFSDSATAASVAEGVLMITHAGKTNRDRVSAALRQLRTVRAHVLGIALNQVSDRLHTYYDYYRTNYSAYYSGDSGNGDENVD